MKKVALITMMAVAVLGLMTSRAWSDEHDWTASITIANAGETPVQLSLTDNDDARARFPGGAETGILQPGQSIVLSATKPLDPPPGSMQWNIVYNFYDGTDTMNQRVSSSYGPDMIGEAIASPSQSGMFSVSGASYVDTTETTYDIGQGMASLMGLSGTGEKVVGGLIDLGMSLAGVPTASTDEIDWYSVTIGQKDYNLDKLAGVDWSSVTAPGTPPAVTLVKGQQVYQYFPANNNWLSSQNLSHQATIADFAGTNVSIGAQDDYIANYGVSGGTPEILSAINFGNNQSVVQVSRNPNGPQCVAAFGDSSVWYYDGVNVQHLSGIGTGSSAILQMCVNWDTAASIPEIVVGCADGQVEHYNGTSWTTLSFGWTGSSVMQLSAYWGANNNLQVVAGLGNGDIYWWNGSTWATLYAPSGYAPVYQLSASFRADGLYQPEVLASLFDGSIVSLYNNGSTNLIRQADDNYCIIDVAPGLTFPTFLAGFSDGSVQLYDGATWVSLQPATGSRVQFLSADWDSFYIGADGFPCVPYVYSINFQFYYGENYSPNSSASFVYSAIPDVNSTCGNIGGTGSINNTGIMGSNNIGSTGLADLISVVGSKWYVWFASSQYSTRGGPYDLGIAGKPVTGDIDGDGQDDLIMVKGSLWYAWLASSGYTQRIGPFDLGIVGKPLTGDIDGDGQDDLIVVKGSLWYYWPSSSGYTQRVGPGDLGIHGLPATGDIDGDGLADLISVVGSDWYVWFSSSQYSTRCGPYDLGVSGAPATGDLDGDGLDDLIVIVGSNWYVWFSTSQYQVPSGPFTMSVP